MRFTLLIAFAAFPALAQIVPGRYVVELGGPPMGVLARQRSLTAEAVNRRTLLHREQSQIQEMITKQGGRVVSHLDNVINALIVDIPEEKASSLRGIAGVKRVFPVTMTHMNLDHALPLHQVPAAWAHIGGMNKAGLGMKIGVLDTGITPNHPAFQDSTLTPPPGYPIVSSAANQAVVNNKIIVARDYSNLYRLTQPDSAVDRLGHGTETADCAAGVPVKGPFTSITGVAPKAFLGVYKIAPLNTGSASSDVIAQALDDAVSDGMDVINLSFGSSVTLFSSLQDYVMDELSQLGVIVVTSAGNSGPFPDTIGDGADDFSVISVGASQSDREFGGMVAAAGLPPISASSGVYSGSNPPVTATLADMSGVDPKNLGCSPLPADSFSGQIVLAQTNSCLFETVLNNAAQAGAVGVIFFSAAKNAARGEFNPLTATLPAVYVSDADGLALRAAIAAGPTSATVTFEGIALPNDNHSLAGFSSRGPTEFSSLKPDLAATGTFIYMATETSDPKGELYSSTGFVQENGTSYSSPIVAGAAAVLKAARPGLTVAQYRSLLINSADPLVQDSGVLERVQHTGVGVLNLDAAVRSTVAAYPTSFTFGLGGPQIEAFDFLTVTNVGSAAETFTITAVPYDYASAPTFATDGSSIFGTSEGNTSIKVTLAPKASQVVDVTWFAGPLVPGEYQGLITITGGTTGSTALVPYWYGFPTGIPAYLSTLGAPAQANAGSTVDLYFKVTDDIGTALVSSKLLGVKSSVVSGGGTIVGPFASVNFVNYLYLAATLGSTPGTNTFRFQVAGFSPITVNIVGVTPANSSQAPPPAETVLPTGVENRVHLRALPRETN